MTMVSLIEKPMMVRSAATIVRSNSLVEEGEKGNRHQHVVKQRDATIAQGGVAETEAKPDINKNPEHGQQMIGRMAFGCGFPRRPSGTILIRRLHRCLFKKAEP